MIQLAKSCDWNRREEKKIEREKFTQTSRPIPRVEAAFLIALQMHGYCIVSVVAGKLGFLSGYSPAALYNDESRYEY